MDADRTLAPRAASGESPGAGPARIVPMNARYVVTAIQNEARDVVSVRLRPEQGALPEFRAGAHLMVHLGRNLARAYSLCNGPDDRETFLIAVKREAASTGGSAAVHALRVGDVIQADAPRNDFEVSWGSRHLILVAAGIGITPLIAMAREAAARAHSFELHYFAQSADAAAFAGELGACAFSDRVTFHFGCDVPTVDARLRERLADGSQGAAVHVCGPRRFIDLVRAICAGGWPPDAVRWESFGGAPPASDGDRPVTLHLSRSGQVVQVPADSTLLQALLDHDVDVPYSCREGQCGMCVVDIVEGTPDHRDDFLNDQVKARGDCMAVCVSRASTASLVLDL